MEHLEEISGLQLGEARMTELMERYRPILKEIEKFRTLDLKDVPPAVHFDPVSAYQEFSKEES